MSEYHTRSIFKAISWRIIATTTTMSAVFIVTGDITVALGVGVIEATAKIFFYYIHERAWLKIGWGQFH